MKIKQEIKSEPQDEEIPFPPSDDETEFNDKSTLTDRTRRIIEIDNALDPTPQKRGRQVGSGAGEKRKADDEYSSNPHTKRARARTQKMSKAEAELARVKQNTSSRKSKARKKLRDNTPNWDTLPAGVQERMIKDVEAQVDARQNELGYTVRHVRSKLENERLKLEEELDYRDRAQVTLLRRKHGITDDDDDADVFWEDDDDEDDSPENDFSKGQDNAEGNSGDILGGIMAGLELWNEQTMTAEEMADFRDQQRPSVRDIVQQNGWDMFQKSLIDRLSGLVIKEDHLRRFHGTEAEWNKLRSTNTHTPDRFFTSKEKALLRYGMAMHCARGGTDWIDLPGPAEWWPTVTGKEKDRKRDKKANKWYLQKGFEFSDADVPKYELATDAIRMKEYPLDWVKNLVHNDGELVWDKFRD